MASNKTMNKAKENKNDEYYTMLEPIETEMKHYRNQFQDKIVFCNCDDPYESNFFKYFAMNFKYLGLKKLIATCYDGSPVAYTQLSIFDMNECTPKEKRVAYKVEITDVKDLNGDGAIDLDDVEQMLKMPDIVKRLEGNGDFRSEECIKLLKEADIVVTNPPFSLFREYLSQLILYEKKFLIIGNPNAIHYKEIFPLIQENKMWLGYKTMSSDMLFNVSDDFAEYLKKNKKEGSGYKYVNGVLKGRAQAVWFTNMDNTKRHEEMILYKNFDPKLYPKYDNYDAIEVSKVDEIPMDYYGIMGVPDSFLDKYNPDQFEILGSCQRGCHNLVPDTKKYDDYWEMKPNGEKTGSKGSKTNENTNIAKNDGKHNYFINAEGHVVQATYSRLFIRRKVNNL